MLKSELFVVKNDAANLDAFKADNLMMLDLVKSLIRNTELKDAQNKKDYKESVKLINATPGYEMKDANTISVEELRAILKNNTDIFVKARNEVIALKEEVANCVEFGKVTSLCNTDKAHVYLMAHAIYKKVVLPDEFFDEDGITGLPKLISLYYNKGTIKDIKNALRPAFNKMIGQEGHYFHGIKIHRSDFSDFEIRNFTAAFGNNGKREKYQEVVDGKKVDAFKDYNYILKTDKKSIINAFTTLCTVVLDNASRHEINDGTVEAQPQTQKDATTPETVQPENK